MATTILEVSTFSKIPSFVPQGVLYLTQDTSDLYIGTGSSIGPAVSFVAGGGSSTGIASVFDVRVYGADPTGVADSSSAFNAALAAAYAAKGGTVYFPTGTYKIASQINIPNDGSTAFNNSPLQPSIRITGSASSGGLIPGGGSTPVPFDGGPAYGGSVLNLTNNSAQAKICSFGTGPLEIDHLTLVDTTTDSASFIFVSNTTLNIHDVSFLGTHVGSAAVNDAIVLGGTSVTASGSFNAPFQGYGAIITHCYFENIKRAVVGQVDCNSVFISENTIWSSCGNTTGGAIELGAAGISTNHGNFVSHNLFECTWYKYGIVIVGQYNKLLHNDFWDTGASFTAGILIGGQNNMVAGGITNNQSNTTKPYFLENNSSLLSNVYIGDGFDPSSFPVIATSLGATAVNISPGQALKVDPANASSVIPCAVTDTVGGIAVGICVNITGPVGGGKSVYVASHGNILSSSPYAPVLGTGTISLGQFVVVDTTTAGRVMGTSTYTPGTVIGICTQAQNTVGQKVGVLLGLR